jgi:hypothetical protein
MIRNYYLDKLLYGILSNVSDKPRNSNAYLRTVSRPNNTLSKKELTIASSEISRSISSRNLTFKICDKEDMVSCVGNF